MARHVQGGAVSLLAALAVGALLDCTPPARHTVPRIVAKHAHKAQGAVPKRAVHHRKAKRIRPAPMLCAAPVEPAPLVFGAPELEPFPPLEFAEPEPEPVVAVAESTPDNEYSDDRPLNPALSFAPWGPAQSPGAAIVGEPAGWEMTVLLGGAVLLSIIIRRRK